MKKGNLSTVLTRFENDERIRYLFGGALCTACGYVLPLLFYAFLHDFLHYVTTSTLAACINISFAFLIHKFYVFRSKGPWIKEYVRCYIVYGSAFLFYMFFVWVLVETFHVSYVVSHVLVNTCAIVMTYFAHKKFTFQKSGVAAH